MYVRNLKFWEPFLTQDHFAPFANILMCFLYFAYNERFYLPEYYIFMLLLSVLYKASTASIRYATTPRSTLEQMKRRRFGTKETGSDQVISGWINAKPAALDEEIKFSMVRNQIENICFYFKNLNKLTHVVRKSLRDFNLAPTTSATAASVSKDSKVLKFRKKTTN